MLIACWMFLTHVVFPQMGNFLTVLINAAMPIIIISAFWALCAMQLLVHLDTSEEPLFLQLAGLSGIFYYSFLCSILELGIHL